MAFAEAAIHCISEYGLESAVFDRLSDQLDIRRSHIHYYFRDRDDLLEAAVKLAAGNAQRITIQYLSKSSNPAQMIIKLGEAAMRWAKDFPEQSRVIFTFYIQASKSKRFADLQNEIRKAGHHRLVLLLKTLNPNKSFAQLSPLAKQIQSVITGMMVEQMTGVIWQESFKSQINLLKKTILQMVAKPLT